MCLQKVRITWHSRLKKKRSRDCGKQTAGAYAVRECRNWRGDSAGALPDGGGNTGSGISYEEQAVKNITAVKLEKDAPAFLAALQSVYITGERLYQAAAWKLARRVQCSLVY